MSSKILFQEGVQRLETKSNYPMSEIRSLVFILLDHMTGLKKTDILADQEVRLSKEEKARYEAYLQRIAQDEPIQYVLGQTEFFGRTFFVNQAVLIPRPETEMLVNWILENPHIRKAEAPQILDIGTGSACIALTLALEIPSAKVFALDYQEEILKVSRQNVAYHQKDIQIWPEDILNIQAQSPIWHQTYDLIVSNPPYVVPSEKKIMHPNVLDHEPPAAIFTEENDPLRFFKAIAQFARKQLKPKGYLYFELNPLFAQDLANYLENEGFWEVQQEPDLRQDLRYLRARRTD